GERGGPPLRDAARDGLLRKGELVLRPLSLQPRPDPGEHRVRVRPRRRAPCVIAHGDQFAIAAKPLAAILPAGRHSAQPSVAPGGNSEAEETDMSGTHAPDGDGSDDVVVIGGGAAGLSGALTLARARRSVLVIDSGEARNAPAEGVHNYLGREGAPPAELYASGREEVERYGGC